MKGVFEKGSNVFEAINQESHISQMFCLLLLKCSEILLAVNIKTLM
jgi:uncharacterized protein with ATP-grasp and redox domains